MATLYEMTTGARQLYEMLDAEEIDETTVQDTLEAYGVEGKLEDYCKVIRQFEADEESYKSERDRLIAKLHAAEKAVERLKGAILTYLQAVGQSKAKAGLFEVRSVASKSVKVEDENVIPAEWFVPQPPKLDKAGLRDALKNGEVIPGASLVENANLRIK